MPRASSCRRATTPRWRTASAAMIRSAASLPPMWWKRRRAARSRPLGGDLLALVHALDQVPLERDVGEQLVEPARQPPGLVAQQRHDGRRDDEPDDQHVDQDREAQAEAEHLPDD